MFTIKFVFRRFHPMNMEELPPLKGTPKQVDWAKKIREAFLYPLNVREELIKQHYPNVLDKIRAKDSAAWWIDHRNTSELDLVKNFEREEAEKAAQDALNAMFEEVAKEIIMEPTEPIGVIAEICIIGKNVCVYTPKNDAVITYMKEMKFSFQDCWWHAGSEDLAAQIGDELLKLGVSVVVNNEVAREKMKDKTYKRYSPRKITVITRKDELYFALTYPYSDNINNISFKYLGARNYDGQRLVHRSKWASIVPFAEELDFIVNDAAYKLIEAMQSRITLRVEDSTNTNVTQDEYAEPGILKDLVDDD